MVSTILCTQLVAIMVGAARFELATSTTPFKGRGQRLGTLYNRPVTSCRDHKGGTVFSIVERIQKG